MDILLPESVETNEWESTPTVADADAWEHVANGMDNPDDDDFVEAIALNTRFTNNLGALSFTDAIGTMRIAFRFSGEIDGVFAAGPSGEFNIALDGSIVTSTKTFMLDTEGGIATGIAVFTTSDFLTTMTGAIWNAATSRRIRCTAVLADRSEDGDQSPGPWFELV